MEYNYMSFLTDFCFMSLLLVIAQFMRAKIKFLQMFYIPASLVAGILGLLLGPQFLDLIPWSGQIAPTPICWCACCSAVCSWARRKRPA